MERPYQDKAILKTRARRTVQVRLPHSEGITHVPGGGEKKNGARLHTRGAADSWDGKRHMRPCSLELCFTWFGCLQTEIAAAVFWAPDTAKWLTWLFHLPQVSFFFFFFFVWILTKCGCLLVGEELTFATGHCRITLGGHGEGAFSDYR